jgi:hypothetical protein
MTGKHSSGGPHPIFLSGIFFFLDLGAPDFCAPPRVFCLRGARFAVQ